MATIHLLSTKVIEVFQKTFKISVGETPDAGDIAAARQTFKELVDMHHLSPVIYRNNNHSVSESEADHAVRTIITQLR